MARVDDIYLHGLCGAHMLMHLRDDHVDDISLHTYKHMYIHRYVVFSCSTDKCVVRSGSPQ